jgi:hypothetical protein
MSPKKIEWPVEGPLEKTKSVYLLKSISGGMRGLGDAGALSAECGGSIDDRLFTYEAKSARLFIARNAAPGKTGPPISWTT